MALKPLNSVGGFSVGEIPANVILSNADIISNNLTVQKIANLGPVGNVKISGGAANQYLQTDGFGNLSWHTADTSTIANGTSNISIPVADGNVNTSVAGNANVFVVTGTGANVTGYFTASGNITGANANLGNLVTANYANLTANLVANNVNVNIQLNGSNANFSGNVQIDQWLTVSNTANVGNLRTDNLLYANGTPWDFQYPAGSNGYIQYNANGDFGASANFTYDDATQQFTLLGNANITQTAKIYQEQLTSLTSTQIVYGNGSSFLVGSANFTFDDLTNTLVVPNANVSGTLNGGTANFTGNVKAANFVGPLANGTSNVSIPTVNGNVNVTVGGTPNVLVVTGTGINVAGTLNATGNANVGNLGAAAGVFTANISSLNANLGNLAEANFVNVSSNLNVVTMANVGNLNVVANVTSDLLPNANLSLDLGAPTQYWDNLYVGNANAASNLTVGLELQANTANFDGNVQMDQWLTVSNTANVGNLRTDNLLYANGQPWDLQEAAGANYEIQYNIGNNFAASANFTYNDAVQTLTVTGNANVTNTVNTPNVNSGTSDLTLSANGYSVTLSAANGNANFPGNVIATTFYGNVNGNFTTTAANTSVLFSDAGLIAGSTGFTFDKNSNLFSTPGNITVNGDALVTGNANFAGNSITISNNFITGNGAGIGIKDDTTGVQLEWNASSYMFVGPNGASLEANSFIANLDNTGNFSLPNNLSVVGNIANANNISVTYELAANTGNFSGNITSLNANLGNLADANYIRTQQLFNGSANIDIINNGNIAFSPTVGNVMIVSSAGVNVVGYVSANGNGTFGALWSNTLQSQGGNLTLYANTTGDNYVELRPSGNGQIDAGSFKIQNLGTPTAGADATTKDYVDNAIAGLTWKQAAELLANTNVALTGTSGTLVIDGHPALTPTENGYRLVLKNQTTGSEDGIYVYNDTGNGSYSITRSADADTYQELEGAAIFILEGTQYANTGWTQTNHYLTSFANQLWVQFAGGGAYTGANGISVVGTIISANVDNNTTEIAGGNIVVKPSANLTTPNIGAATGTSLDLTGNVLANNLNANALVTAANIQVTGNVLAGNLLANSNITSNNATINLALSGNTANFIGNVILNNLTVNLELAGGTANFSGNINSALNANLGNLVTANFFTGTLVNGTSNAGIDGLNGNFNVSVNGNANVLQITGSNANVSGGLNVTGNITANNFVGNAVTANLQMSVGTTQIIYGNVTTTSIGANQTIATVSIAGVTGVEWLVKGYDSSGSKYSMAIVTAVTDGVDADYSTFGTVNLGGTTGTLAVNVSGSNLELQVTPASTNSTVWVTQFRTI